LKSKKKGRHKPLPYPIVYHNPESSTIPIIVGSKIRLATVLVCGRILKTEETMRINDEQLLREMRSNKEKHLRVNCYKVKYMKFDGKHEELLFNQGYDHSTDIYNPFFVRVYRNGSYYHSGAGETIEAAYNDLITSLIQYKDKAETERNEAQAKLAKIIGIIAPDFQDEYDDRL
jgi:hypothetical protein